MIFFVSVIMSALASTPSHNYQIYKQIAFSKSESVNKRWEAIMNLSDILPIQAKKDLKLALKNNEWFVRNAALLSLNKVSTKEAQQAALELLDDPALVVRSAAVEVLDASASLPRAALWKELQHSRNFRKSKSLWIRSQILNKLSQTAQPSEKKNFLSFLDDDDMKVRQVAKSTLDKLIF